jgi:hypothetical protein
LYSPILPNMLLAHLTYCHGSLGKKLRSRNMAYAVNLKRYDWGCKANWTKHLVHKYISALNISKTSIYG